MTKKRRLPRTTVGRFWGYNGVLIALSVSLAGNLAAAYLHNEDPSWVELSFAGIPPLTAFLSIEIVNHNPWADEKWGPWVRRILLGVVAPASAIVSFIHLVTVVMEGRTQTGWLGGLNWLTAVLTALLIDGMMFGGTAALLIKPKAKPADTPLVLTAVPDWRAEFARKEADLEATIERMNAQIAEMASVMAKSPARARTAKAKTPVLQGRLAEQTQPEERDRKRWAPREHPLWEDFVAANGAWSPVDLQQQMKSRMDREITIPAAGTMLGRWKKEYANV